MELVLNGDKPLATATVLGFQTGHHIVVIDATRIGFISPLDLAGVLAIAHFATVEGLQVTVRLPSDPGAASYFQRMDVLRRLPARTRIVGRPLPEKRTDLSHRLLEASPLTAANVDDLAERVGNLVTAYYPNVAGLAVARACNELLDNAVEHGASPTGAFIAAQTYTGKTTTGQPRLELAVCDTGVGVLNHLRQNPDHQHLTSDQQALRKALRQKVSGTTETRGNGLDDLIEAGQRHGTIRLRLRSGAGELSVTATAGQHRRVAPVPRPDRTIGTWAWLSHDLPHHPQ